MRILLTGGTGFIGKRLVRRLVEEGHTCVVLVRRSPSQYKAQEGVTYLPNESLATVRDIDAVINLAGETVVGIWTSEKRKRIIQSRVVATRSLVEWMEALRERPRVLLSASAVGIYGNRPHELLTERSALDPKRKFRYEVCTAWEGEAEKAEALGVRVVLMRLGNVMSREGGVLGMALPLLRFAPVLVPPAPKSSLAWIALPDVLSMFSWALQNDVSGPLNVTGPEPATFRMFVKAIGKTLQRPVVGGIPPVLMGVLGEFGRSQADSQDVRPEKSTNLGFRFEHPSLPDFIRSEILRSRAQ